MKKLIVLLVSNRFTFKKRVSCEDDVFTDNMYKFFGENRRRVISTTLLKFHMESARFRSLRISTLFGQLSNSSSGFWNSDLRNTVFGSQITRHRLAPFVQLYPFITPFCSHTKMKFKRQRLETVQKIEAKWQAVFEGLQKKGL